MTLLVDKFGPGECLAMLDRIEEVLKVGRCVRYRVCICIQCVCLCLCMEMHLLAVTHIPSALMPKTHTVPTPGTHTPPPPHTHNCCCCFNTHTLTPPQGKAGRLANGPGYLDVSVSTRLDELKQRASGERAVRWRGG
mgnify:CR=1 FL=1